MSAGQGPGRDSILPLAGSSNYQNPSQVPSNAQHGRNAGSISAPSTALPSNIQGYGTPQRGPTQGSTADAMYHGGSQNPYTPQSAHHARYSSQSGMMGEQPPNIQFQQATPHGSQYNTPSSSNVPDVLQPGGSARPVGSSTYPPPSTVPSMPSSNAQQHYVPPPRAGILGSSHSHSKSSPVGLDQKYIPFSSTTPTVTPGAGSKMFPPQTPTGPVSYSPLGLSDIRPSIGSDHGVEMTGPNAVYDVSPVQTNSNYLAPWATYAYDWCKWPVSSGGSCGKMALGSYLEDPHNFVCAMVYGSVTILTVIDSNTGHSSSATGRCHAWRSLVWYRIHQDSRGNMRIPGDSDLMGASFVTKAVDRFTRNIWRPSQAVVLTPVAV